MTRVADPLVGRANEVRTLEGALERLPCAVELVGEPGIGKTRLLAELERIADERGCVVLSGSASELERDLPFWVFVDALEDYVRGLPPSVPLPEDLPWVSRFALADERHRTHQAVRELLTLVASRQPLVLILDDLHWADPGSLELLGSLLRRPPTAPVLLAVAVRPRQVPEKLLPALERSHRAGTLDPRRARGAPREDAKQLHGEAADTVYEESGGNPFYLQQLARALGRTGRCRATSPPRSRRSWRCSATTRAGCCRAPRSPATPSSPSWLPRRRTSTTRWTRWTSCCGPTSCARPTCRAASASVTR